MARGNDHQQRLANLLWEARTSNDAKEIVELAAELYGTSWRAVGDRPNNIGTIGMASQPGLALVERITNMADAMLELGRELDPSIDVTSPRQAATEFYGVPTSGLADMLEPRPIAEKMVVSLEPSGSKKRPTVVVHDQGIGQTAAASPRTLLSLNESNKVDKPWTMGTYGQGGSVTYGFCEATVIVTRRHPQLLPDGVEDHVAWTVVLKRYDDTKKLPNYEYLVGADDEVLSLPPELFPDLPHGTRVTHVEYDLQISGPFTTNPYQFFNSALFDPVLPFVLTGSRGKENDYGSRVIRGNAARLRNVEQAKGDIDVAHSDIIKLDLGARNGSVTVRYWVLRRPPDSTSKSDPTASYVAASDAICVTLHGQRHDSEERYWIKRNANLSILYKNMIVQIDASDLTGQAKAELFASTRERGRTSEIRTRIYEDLAYTLRNDPQLKQLNHEEKERLLARSTAAANDKVRKRLSKFINHKLEEFRRAGRKSGDGTSGEGDGDEEPQRKKKGGGGGGHRRDTSDDHLPNVPTHLRFARNHIRVRQAARTHALVEIDAKNRYLPNNDEFLDLAIDGPDPDAVRIASRSALMGGQARWVVEADEDAPLGEYKVDASLTTPNGLLHDALVVQVIEKRQGKRKKAGGKEPETGPEVRWVFKNQWDQDPFKELNFHAKAVGRVLEDDESTIIFVNRHYEELDRAFKGRNLTADQMETRADRYQYPVACGLWLQEFYVNHLVDEDDRRPTEEYLDAEMRRLADAVLVAVDPDVDLAAEEEDYK